MPLSLTPPGFGRIFRRLLLPRGPRFRHGLNHRLRYARPAAEVEAEVCRQWQPEPSRYQA